MAHMNDATASNIPTNIASTSVASSSPSAASLVTPGWQTSEFWMTALGQLGLVLAAASGALPARYAVIAGAASQVAYTLSRGIAKSNAATAN